MRTTSQLSASFLLRCATLFGFILLFGSQDSFSQNWNWPEKSENLKVLPENTSAEELGATMRGFTQALGVRCEHCHDDTNGNQLSQMDFAADTKETKEIARIMLQMVNRVNDNELTKVTDLGRSETLRVTCVTCHRGNSRPEMIQDVLVEATLEEGIDEGIAKYRSLRERHHGGFTYDFSERSLLSVAGALAEQEKMDEAIKFMELNLEMFPDSWQTYVSLARTYQGEGNNEEAVVNLEKAIELNPESGFLRRMLQQFKGQ